MTWTDFPTGIAVEQLLTAREVAAILRCSPAMVGDLRRAGRLHAVLVGRTYRFPQDAVRAFINGEVTQ